MRAEKTACTCGCNDQERLEDGFWWVALGMECKAKTTVTPNPSLVIIENQPCAVM
jgi:hypothetical protein